MRTTQYFVDYNFFLDVIASISISFPIFIERAREGERLGGGEEQENA